MCLEYDFDWFFYVIMEIFLGVDRLVFYYGVNGMVDYYRVFIDFLLV